jgi:hypothetical protein
MKLIRLNMYMFIIKALKINELMNVSFGLNRNKFSTLKLHHWIKSYAEESHSKFNIALESCKH